MTAQTTTSQLFETTALLEEVSSSSTRATHDVTTIGEFREASSRRVTFISPVITTDELTMEQTTAQQPNATIQGGSY